MTHDHHGHAHGNPTVRAQNRVRLAWTLALTLLYMLAEIVGGYASGSLALLADAGHMFSDAAALGLSLFAAWISARPPTAKLSYGYYRAEILAALANGATLVAIAILIVIEAIHRLSAPQPVAGLLMLGIASGGLVINIVGLAILNGGKGENLNMHGAWLHLLTDALGSVAALVAGGLIWLAGWYWVDPVASILIALLVTYSSWNLLKQAIAILMESTPAHLDVDRVRSAMAETPGARGVHDLHIWTITSGMVSLSAHVVLANGHDPSVTLEALSKALHDRFGIDHVTIQIEPDGPQHCQTSF
ncbi:MAG: cation diffusion facilitator family transporter [Pirellulales bacterium]